MVPLRMMNSSSSSAQQRQGPSQLSQSQPSQRRLKVADIRFVLCETQTEEDRQLLTDTYAFCRAKDVSDAAWVTNQDLNTLTQRNSNGIRVLYVVHPFSGPAFDALRASGSPIYSPRCVVSCLERNIVLPKYRGYPVTAVALMHTEVCCSNLNAKDRDTVMAKVGSLGGNVTRAMATTATHLVTPQTGSEKYAAAVKAGNIHIVTPAWVEAVLKRAAIHPGEDLSFDQELIRQHRVAVFSGLTISLTGITNMEIRRAFEAKIKANGGKYLRMLERGQNTHLICDEPVGEKYHGAVRWKIPVVKSSWIDACIEKGYCLDILPFLLTPVMESKRATTPDPTQPGPSGDRATSTPLKGAKQLDNSLDISAIPKVSFWPLPPPPPPPPPAPMSVRSEAIESHVQPRSPDWRPKVPAAEDFIRIHSQSREKDQKVVGNFSSAPPPKQRSSSPEKQRLKKPCSDGSALGQMQPSLAERILALKKPSSAPAVMVSPGISASTAVADVLPSTPSCSNREAEPPLHVQKLQKKASQAGSGVKRVGPLLCWSQAPRNPFDEADFVEQADDSGHVEPSDNAPPPACGNGKRAASVVDLADDEESEIVVAPPVAPKVVRKPGKTMPVVMFSGFNVAAEKAMLMRCVTQLGAQCLESVQYQPEMTHLIVKYPVKNEKYLSCCASGKWVLHPRYLEDSAAAGHFLPETMYEWGNPECAASLMSSLSESDNTLAKCVYRWRTRVQQTGQPAYYGWKVVLAADPKRMDGYIRLLEAGGAKVLASAPPYRTLQTNDASHFLHEPLKTAVSTADLEHFTSNGVNIRRVDFISTYLTDESLTSLPPADSRNKAKRTKAEA